VILTIDVDRQVCPSNKVPQEAPRNGTLWRCPSWDITAWYGSGDPRARQQIMLRLLDTPVLEFK
jgi:hypothetical protein